MWLKSIVTELEPKNKIFVRKRAPSWFFAFAGVKKLFFLIFLSENVILDKFRPILACIRVSPRHHPCTSYVYLLLSSRDLVFLHRGGVGLFGEKIWFFKFLGVPKLIFYSNKHFMCTFEPLTFN